MIDLLTSLLERHFPHIVDEREVRITAPEPEIVSCACGVPSGTREAWLLHVSLVFVNEVVTNPLRRVQLLEEKLRQGAALMRQLDARAPDPNLSGLATAFEALSDLDGRDSSIRPRCVKTREPVDEARLLVEVPKPCDCAVCSTVREHLLKHLTETVSEDRCHYCDDKGELEPRTCSSCVDVFHVCAKCRDGAGERCTPCTEALAKDD